MRPQEKKQSPAGWKHLLVTGGTEGIGLAAAEALAPLVEELRLSYRADEDKARRAAEIIAGYQKKCILLPSDVTQPEAAKTLARKLKETQAIPDILVLNAGVTNRKDFWSLSLADWQEVLQGNLLYNISLIQELGQQMKKGSCIIVTGSLMGVYPHSVSIPYGVSKTALHALVQNLCKVLSPLGIRINAVAPGFVDTSWQKNKPQEVRRSIESKIALGRFAEPSEVGMLFRFIAENTYLTGQILQIDGGYSYR